jgi:ABC-type transport system involved in multi-copper enzyme maturation permease subunit
MVGIFLVRCEESGWVVTHQLMARVALTSLGFSVGYYALLAVAVITQAALCVADEKNRRTLDFLLATRLSNAEIVLGKLAACLSVSFTTMSAGVPVMLLLVLFGGIDYRLVLTASACVASLVFFISALAILISTGARDVARAVSFSVLCTMAWLMGPMMLAFIMPRFGVHLPWWASTVNAWLLRSSPLGLVSTLAYGVGRGGLYRAVGEMIGLQLLFGVALLIWAIVWLRAAYRENVGGDSPGLGRRRVRPAWRFRPRPAVGDDPILWRVKYTTRDSVFAKLVGLIISIGALGTLAYVTYFFARPALIEVWNHGYSSGATTEERPEMNLIVRFFVPAVGGFNEPVDLARTEFNLFLRHATSTIGFFVTLMAMGFAAEVVTTERRRETWDSLLATPLTGRDMARTQLVAAVWRLRWIFGTLFVLWATGLIAGAIHPLGFVIPLLEMAASTWFLIALGIMAALRSKEVVAGMTPLLVLAMVGSIALPWLPLGRFSSVLLGTASAPFLEWLSLMSYRDVRAAAHYSTYPPLAWIGIHTGEGPLRAVATCLLGIVAPALAGVYVWRNVIADFDRLVGRPWKDPKAAVEQRVEEPVAVGSEARTGRAR